MKSLNVRHIENDFFKGKDPLGQILSISLDLLGAKHSGLLYGTDSSHVRFLPSSSWDRGVMDRFDGRGATGWLLRLLGKYIVTARGLSPIYFYRTSDDGRCEDTQGIIAYVLRNCADYYKKGINVVICPDTANFIREPENDPDPNSNQAVNGTYHSIPFYIYNGNRISRPKNHIKVDTRIVRQFKSSNSIYIILPDYGIMVINTADPSLLALDGDRFVREADLRDRLDILIRLVEVSSLAYLGTLKGKKGAELLWRKEAHLRKAYADLADKEKKFRDLYENAPIAYFSMDEAGVIFQCNRQAETLSGFSRDELIGKTTGALFTDPEVARSTFLEIRESLKDGSPVKDLELKLTRRNGEFIWVSLSIDAVMDKGGQIRELRAMALDISRRRTLEKQLVHAQKMEAIGTLARGIAHDFNNVLSPVSGYAQMLLMDEGRSSEETENIRVILECTRHAKDLVNQILTFSRQKEHRLVLVRAGETVLESMGLLRSCLPSSIDITTKIDPECGYIMADPVQLHQVIMNLATNAFHAMADRGGRLEVGLVRQCVQKGEAEEKDIPPGSYVCLSVGDSGPGIDPAVLPKIFEPYYTTKKEGKGSGVGLSVVHGVVEAHSGHIRVTSTLGEGTCFSIYLPVCRKQGEAYTYIDQPQTAEIETGSETILLVDDDVRVAFLHTRILERLGYTVKRFTRSRKALDAFGESSADIDLVITDYTMPEMDGLELAAEVRRLDSGIPVLVCTGLGDHMETDEETRDTVAGFIGKPVDIRQMAALVRRTLDSSAP